MNSRKKEARASCPETLGNIAAPQWLESDMDGEDEILRRVEAGYFSF